MVWSRAFSQSAVQRKAYSVLFWRTMSGLLGLLLLAWSYVAVGAFASSVTRNQLIAFFLACVPANLLGRCQTELKQLLV